MDQSERHFKIGATEESEASVVVRPIDVCRHVSPPERHNTASVCRTGDSACTHISRRHILTVGMAMSNKGETLKALHCRQSPAVHGI